MIGICDKDVTGFIVEGVVGIQQRQLGGKAGCGTAIALKHDNLKLAVRRRHLRKDLVAAPTGSQEPKSTNDGAGQSYQASKHQGDASHDDHDT